MLADQVMCHPFVVGELACGGIRHRQEFLTLLSALRSLPKADDEEVLDLIDRHRLMGKGVGLVDVHLLASCLLAGVPLWTYDKPLAEAARQLGISSTGRGG